MGSLSIAHWLLVGIVVALVFGPKKFADMGKGLGEGIKNFKQGLKDDPAPRQEPPQLKGGEDKPVES